MPEAVPAHAGKDDPAPSRRVRSVDPDLRQGGIAHSPAHGSKGREREGRKRRWRIARRELWGSAKALSRIQSRM